MLKEEKTKKKEKMICILTGPDKTASVKLLPLTINSLNAYL